MSWPCSHRDRVSRERNLTDHATVHTSNPRGVWRKQLSSIQGCCATLISKRFQNIHPRKTPQTHEAILALPPPSLLAPAYNLCLSGFACFACSKRKRQTGVCLPLPPSPFQRFTQLREGLALAPPVHEQLSRAGALFCLPNQPVTELLPTCGCESQRQLRTLMKNSRLYSCVVFACMSPGISVCMCLHDPRIGVCLHNLE